MKIDKTSWHWKLVNTLATNSVSKWKDFHGGRVSLCEYWRTVFRCIINSTTLVVLWIAIGIFMLLPLAVPFYGWHFWSDIPIASTIAWGTILFIGCGYYVCESIKKFLDRQKHKPVNSKYAGFKAYLKAKKNKFCPILDLTDDVV